MCTDCKELTIPTGAPGTNGTNGAPGVKGDTGLTGANGQNGTNGTTILATYNSTTGIGTDADILEKTLFTYNVPANTLATNGDELNVFIYYEYTASSPVTPVTLRVKLGSKIITLVISETVNCSRTVTLKISKISNTSQFWIVETTSVGGIVSGQIFRLPTTSTVDLSTTLAFEISGENSAAVANQLILKKATLYKYAI